MKQQIVFLVAMHCDKCRRRALRIAAKEKGVSSVSLEGPDNNLVVVTGKVDSVSLAKRLRKKVGHATITSVQVLKEDDGKEEDKEEVKEPTKDQCSPPCPCPVYYPVPYYDPYPSICTIL